MNHTSFVVSIKQYLRLAVLASMSLLLIAPGSAATNENPVGITGTPKGVIAYAVTSLFWAIYETKGGKTECPDGRNIDRREQFKALFPTDKPTAEMVLKFDNSVWFPTELEDKFPFREAMGPISYGLNLDGKIGPNDFKSPDGEPGIDNQLYRAIGCIEGFRTSDNGIIQLFSDLMVRDTNYNRWMIELSGVDDLTNDDSVDVIAYRGLDNLVMDSTASEAVPGASQRIDVKRGAKFVHKFHGKIVDGVLITDPTDFYFPWSTAAGHATNFATDEWFRDGRLRVKLTPERGEGLIAGYVDVDTWYNNTARNNSVLMAVAKYSGSSLYRALHRLADAYPDPQTGANTAISAALRAKFVRVFINHSPSSATSSVASNPQELAR